MAQTPEERCSLRAGRERQRRARLREAGIKVTRSDAYKEQHCQQERIRRATPEGKQYELEYRRKYRAANREQFRAYSREFARRRRAKLKANAEVDPGTRLSGSGSSAYAILNVTLGMQEPQSMDFLGEISNACLSLKTNSVLTSRAMLRFVVAAVHLGCNLTTATLPVGWVGGCVAHATRPLVAWKKSHHSTTASRLRGLADYFEKHQSGMV